MLRHRPRRIPAAFPFVKNPLLLIDSLENQPICLVPNRPRLPSVDRKKNIGEFAALWVNSLCAGSPMSSKPEPGQSVLPVESHYPKRILSVDDEPGILWTRQTILQNAGYEVVSVADGEQALHYFGLCPFDVVLLDYLMPGMHGGEVARAIKLSNPAVPVIMVSASAAEEKTLSGVDCFIRKGAGPEVLLAKIAELLLSRRVVNLQAPAVRDGNSSITQEGSTRHSGPNR